MSLLRNLPPSCGLRPLDIHSAEMLERLYGQPCPELLLAAAFASQATGQGHTCLPLANLTELLAPYLQPAMNEKQLHNKLLATSVVGQAGDHTPLILDSNQLYLRRFYRYEERVAAWLRQQAATQTELPNGQQAKELLASLFPQEAGTINWQAIAAALALIKPFLVIAGGPGTGKTYTVARILALLQVCLPKLRHQPRIALAAPTGKAALRLQESIRQAQQGVPEPLAQGLTTLAPAQTLHRLLGFGPNSGFFFQAKNPLPLDVLVVDEASMVDLPLMAALLEALPLSCRLILLGDPDQLASVEAGNLLGDICGNSTVVWSEDLRHRLQELTNTRLAASDLAWDSSHGLDDTLVFLQQSRRFAGHSAFAELASAVRQADPRQVKEVIRKQSIPSPESDTKNLHLEDCQGDSANSPLQQAILKCFLPLMEASNSEAAFQTLTRQRILCALRGGPEGVEGINRLAELLLRRRGHILPGVALYRGMPIMIQRNDYGLGLFNGDTGILWPNAKQELLAWFPKEDGSLRSINPSRLPIWQRSYAMTVHKSQGSEFAHVFLVLPKEENPVLSRELLYTAITRGRKDVTIIGKDLAQILPWLAQQRLQRHTGLAARLLRQDAIT